MMETVKNYFKSPAFYISAVIVILTVALYLLIRYLASHYRKKSNGRGERTTLMHVMFRLTETVILIAGFVILLQTNGINISALAAGIGLFGIVIGLAVQDYLKDIVMGLHILVDHFFSVGECVEYEGKEGVIVGLDLMTTKIGDLDDHAVTTVCNRNFGQIRRLSNKLDVDIPLSYEESLADVKTLMTAICDALKTDRRVQDCTFEGTQSLESSFVYYRLRICCEPHERADVRRLALSTAEECLAAAGKKFPYPHLDVSCLS